MSEQDTKKVLLFIVEGPSDENSLGPAMEKIAESRNVKFKVMHTDITCDLDSSVANIERRIKEKAVRKFLQDIQNSQLCAKDICEIVHIVDMDGAFIEDSSVVQGDVDKPCYEDNQIICKDRAMFLKTKANKKNILNHLINLNDIDIPYGYRVPYSIFFMSCNLDHVLHEKRNSTKEEKKQDSIMFADNYDDADAFKEFFNKEEIKVKGTYLETWEYVKNDYNSLSRCSNFWIYIDRYN